MMTVKDKARKVQSYVIQRVRASGELYSCLSDATPDAIRDLVRKAHGTDVMPDDYRFEAVACAIDHFAAGGTLGDYRPPCDVYTSALLSYLGSSGDRIARANEAIAEGSAATIENAAMVAQWEEAAEVAYRLEAALGDLDEDDSGIDITDDQIERFGQEAGEAGDLEAVAICRRAIAGDDLARAEVAEWITESAAMRDDEEE